MRALRIVSITSAAFAFALVVWGGIVRINNAGMTCPDWPRCRGVWFPSLNGSVIFEWSHRVGAPVLTLLIIVTLVAAWAARAQAPRSYRIAWLALGMLAVQIVIGALTIRDANSPPSVALHLIVGIATLVSLFLVALASYGPSVHPRGEPSDLGARRFAWLALATTVLALAAVAAGGYMSAAGAGLACPGLPLCNGWAGAHGFAQKIHMLHRLLAYATVAAVAVTWVVAQATKQSRVVLATAWMTLVLVIAQAAFGAFTVLTRLNPMLRSAHQGVGVLLVGAISALTYVAFAQAAFSGRPLGRPEPGFARPLQQRWGPLRWRRHLQLDRYIRLARDYVALTKPKVMSLLLFTTFMTMLIAAGSVPRVSLLAWTLLGGALAAASAAAINMYLDRDLDAKMRRTKARPLPSGRIPPRGALIFGCSLGAFSFAALALAVNVLSAALALVGILYYVFVYTLWLKRRTPQNIVIGGAAGAVPPLVGWAAVTNHVGLTAIALFLIVFIWTPPHFWALALLARKEYAGAGIPMLPVLRGDPETRRQILVYTAALAALTLILVPMRAMGIAYLAGALALDAVFLMLALRVVRLGTATSERALYRYSMLYLALLFAVMAVDRILHATGA